MTETTEARWFLPGPLPPDAEAWWAGLGAPVEAEARTDRYLAPRSPDEPGVKLRGGRVEVKQRAAALGTERLGAAEGAVEAWRKWGFVTVASDATGWVAVAKRRRQRFFAVADGRVEARDRRPQAGAAVELSEVEAGGACAWSICVEATGPDEAARLATLRAVAAHVFGPDAPALPAARSVGYPAWLWGAMSEGGGAGRVEEPEGSH